VKSKWKEGREVLNLRQPLAQQQLNLRQPLAQQQADDEDEAAVPPETYVVITALDESTTAPAQSMKMKSPETYVATTASRRWTREQQHE
jgi:hypothetical protein